MSVQIAHTATMPKELKASKHRIHLSDGRELQFHPPFAKTTPISLSDFVPKEKIPALEVEIGCGKGEFIAKRAAAHPERFFVGIDRRNDRHQLTENKLKRLAPESNWRVLNEDARCFVETALPPIQTLHVYHPDPWPKSRHHKHRFFRSPDAKIWCRAIVSGGFLSLSSDHREYFEEILDVVEYWKLFKLGMIFQKNPWDSSPSTHFEGIFFKKGEPVYKAIFVKI